jgi:ketosteroid isomerase-like protein
MNTRAAWLGAGLALAIFWAVGTARARDENGEARSIEHLIQLYAQSVDAADTALAEQIWSDSPEVTFIHPLGEEHGRAQVEEDVYRRLMGEMFSQRKLTPSDVSVHVYGDAAWSEFRWDFTAVNKRDGKPVHTRGRETQVYHKEHGQWRLVHVHYSAAPAVAPQ